MYKTFVITHGNAAEGLIHSCEMILGQQEELYAISLKPTESLEGFIEKVSDVFKKHEGEKLVLVDILGGTPCNSVCVLCEIFENTKIISGVNLAMILTASMFKSQNKNLNEITQSIIDESMQSIQLICI